MRMGSAGARAVVAVLAILVAGARCGGDAKDGAVGGSAGGPPENHDTRGGSVAPHQSAAGDTAALPPCPPTGHWAVCSVVDRLENAGLVTQQKQDRATEAPLTASGVAFTVRDAELEVYIYPDAAARERDQARLDADEYLEPDQPPGGVHKPTLIGTDNLLVVLDTWRERQRERITLALTAGAPQPPQP